MAPFPRRRAHAVVTTFILIAAGIAAFAPSAAAGPESIPSPAVNYEFPTGSTLSSVDWAIRVEADPGSLSYVFWINQFHFGDGAFAYTGLQTNGGGERTFLFSVWDATEAKPGSPGSYCLPFKESRSGQSCRMKYDWKAGQTYRFHLAAEDDQWFGMTVTNPGDHTSFKLGSIRAGDSGISPAQMTNWVEYYEWNLHRATCHEQPYTRAWFATPVSGTLTADVTGTDTHPDCGASATPSGGGYVLVGAEGNSARGRITQDHICLQAAKLSNNQKVLGAACTDDQNQWWVRAKDATVRVYLNYCLTATGTAESSPVVIAECTGADAQKWTVESAGLKNTASGRCLTLPGGGHTDPQLVVSTCTGGADQRWSLPPTPGSL
ncbi:ricin-type beta-trefoil lectin domain protein [Streptosporangium algeriense]|uniref:Ricin-type beta-trefoil lectin domain protein n=1 Tax=Streptosporangium algeriense TaxID=1682748 RepID=A0ABW3DN84_9ACTN